MAADAETRNDLAGASGPRPDFGRSTSLTSETSRARTSAGATEEPDPVLEAIRSATPDVLSAMSVSSEAAIRVERERSLVLETKAARFFLAPAVAIAVVLSFSSLYSVDFTTLTGVRARMFTEAVAALVVVAIGTAITSMLAFPVLSSRKSPEMSLDAIQPGRGDHSLLDANLYRFALVYNQVVICRRLRWLNDRKARYLSAAEWAAWFTIVASTIAGAAIPITVLLHLLGHAP